MGFLSDIDIEERVNNPDNLINRLTVHEISRGRGDSIDTPIEIKKIAAILNSQGEKVVDLAKTFNVDNSGLLRESSSPPELKELVRKIKSQNELNRETAESLAVSNLLASLNLIPNNLNKPKTAKAISSVAKDMAMISNMMGNRADPDGKGERAMHLHLYAPRQKELKDYDVIDINAE